MDLYAGNGSELQISVKDAVIQKLCGGQPVWVELSTSSAAGG